MKTTLIWVAIIAAILIVGSVVVFVTERSEQRDREAWARHAEEEWSGRCHDESWLLATTAGSPDKAKCPHKLHRMRVQVATHPSNEEAAALVFCECAQESKP